MKKVNFIKEALKTHTHVNKSCKLLAKLSDECFGGSTIFRKLTVVLLAAILATTVALSGCSSPGATATGDNDMQAWKDFVATLEPVSKVEVAEDEVPSDEPLGDMGPYDYAWVVQSAFIFKGEILSVEPVEVHSEYMDSSGLKKNDSIQSLMKVRVDKVYVGEAPEGKKEIIVYCPTSDSTTTAPSSMSLSAGLEYVFFSNYWDDEEMLDRLNYCNTEKYQFPERSDVSIRHPADNLAISQGGFIAADRAWANQVPPSIPMLNIDPNMDGKITDEEQRSFNSGLDDWLAFTKGYAVGKPESIGVFSCIYSEEDFVLALNKLRELYPTKPEWVPYEKLFESFYAEIEAAK